MLSKLDTRSLVLVGLTSLGLGGFFTPVNAQPWRLPYESQPPFIPVLDLFGEHGSGLVLGAEEVITGLPAPLSIGNATFVPGVDLDGMSTKAFTKFRGDVLIRRGDLYIGRQAVGETLEHQSTAINQLGESTVQLWQSQDVQDQRLQGHAAAINQLGASTVQLWQSQDLQDQQLQGHASAINQLGASTVQLWQSQDLQDQQLQGHAAAINQLGATTEQLGQSLQQHSDVLNTHSQVLQRHEADLKRVDQNVQNLGSGVAGSTALAAALTRMPMDLNGAPLACGLGTGGYSSRYAMALGCTVELIPSLAFNAGGAYLFGGGSDYGSGSLSNVAGAVGLVYRFGKKGTSGGDQSVEQSLRKEIAVLKGFNSDLSGELLDLKRRLVSLESLSQLPKKD